MNIFKKYCICSYWTKNTVEVITDNWSKTCLKSYPWHLESHIFKFTLALILITSPWCYVINECLDLLQSLKTTLFNTVVLGYSPQYIMIHMASTLFHLTAHCHHINANMLQKSLSGEMYFLHMLLYIIPKEDLVKVMGKMTHLSLLGGG